MQSKKLGNERIWMLDQIVIVILEDISQQIELPLLNCLEHVQSIGSVIEETAAFSLTRQLCQARHLAHQEGSQ